MEGSEMGKSNSESESHRKAVGNLKLAVHKRNLPTLHTSEKKYFQLMSERMDTSIRNTYFRFFMPKTAIPDTRAKDVLSYSTEEMACLLICIE